MPSKKKNSKDKARKAAGKGGAKYGDGNEQKQGTLDSQMQRLQIADKQKADADDEDAMLEEAIQLAATEKQEIEKKAKEMELEEKKEEKENCKHGFHPSSRSHEHFCKDFMQTVMDLLNFASITCPGSEHDDPLGWFMKAFDAAAEKHISWMCFNSHIIMLKSCFLAEGTKCILGGNSDDARIQAKITQFLEGVIATSKKVGSYSELDFTKMEELGVADEHTLVQFYRKQIPCACLDDKYNEVKSVTKMGLCCNEACPLLDQRAVRSKMVCCARCRKVNYCSRECQVAAWPGHKGECLVADA